MFARTPRLLLRPGFPEDAPALAVAIADEAIVRNLAVVPWAYGLRDAEAFLASPRDPILPSFLIFERTASEPRLIGLSYAFEQVTRYRVPPSSTPPLPGDSVGRR